MSETTFPQEPLRPETHLQVVRTAQALVAALLKNDQEKGNDPILMSSQNGRGEDVIPRLVYDFSPVVPNEWIGKFFGGPETRISILAPISKEDPDQEILMFGMNVGITDVDAIKPGHVYQSPTKKIAIAFGEQIPEVTTNPSLVLAEDYMPQESSLSNGEGLNLLADLADILQMQQGGEASGPTSIN